MRRYLPTYLFFLALVSLGFVPSAMADGLSVPSNNPLSSSSPSALATFQVDVTKTGSGTVTSDPVGINCGSTCAASFNSGSSVTLTAVADSGNRFTGWGGDCSGQSATCSLTVDNNKFVDAGFVNVFALNVAKTGVGSGRVISFPDLTIDCGSKCSADYDSGTSVTLEALPDSGSVFTGWSGGGCSGTGSCVVTMDQARSVSANFATGFDLNVFKSGSGSGTVSSSPAGISCGVDCSEGYASNTEVTLTASPASGSRFTGWTGACSGTGNCVVTMSKARAVTATFIAVYDLTISKTGSGSGTVSSSPAGISCGVDCSESYDSGQSVTLTAVAAAGSKFTGWSGGGCSGSGSCTVTIDQARSVSAGFALAYTVTVTKSGAGTGTVSSLPVGISCGAICSASFAENATVTLTATATAGSRFAGWSGEGCSGTGSCVVNVDQARAVTATFNQARTATVNKTGSGSGAVSSLPAGISCGATCSASFDKDALITLSASPDAGSRFAGWTGEGCSGTGDCLLTMDQARTVSASFISIFTLTITKSGDGQGTVTSSPAGIDCGLDCSENYDSGTTVTLSASAEPGSRFDGFSGEGCSGTGDCVVTLDQARSVTATFTAAYDLTVHKTGTGAGVVTSSPAGIDCGLDCSQSFNAGQEVTLTATPAATSTFVGWSGAGCSGTGDCVVTIDQARSVTAEFKQTVFTLTVSTSGQGTVVSSPGGIDCGLTCSFDFNQDSTVTLTATPSSGYIFTGWSGAGCAGTDECSVVMSNVQEVTATFTPAYTLTVSKSGSGSGLVSSSPAGIDCGLSCSALYEENTLVTLSATASPGSRFAGWVGEGCSGTGDCVVTLDQARAVAAQFTTIFTLDVVVSGSGTITSQPAGIDCGSDCSQSYDTGTEVQLTATAESGWRFVGWSGACSGNGGCLITMSQARTVTANFVQIYELGIIKAGSGAGTVSSSPVGISCGLSCSVSFDKNSVVVLTASAAVGSKFTGWSGPCSGVSSCTVTMSQARTVTANFIATYALTVTKSGAGAITSSPAGINCGSDCSETYDDGTAVTLSASPSSGYRFAGWSGACSGTGGCTVTMSQARSVSASFTPVYTLSVSLIGAGSGAVSSSPTGIDCGGDCSESYQDNTVVVLTATPDANSRFAGWSGACSGTGGCTVTMSQARSVSASFTPAYQLLVNKSGDGSGVINSSPQGIDCGDDCTESYNVNALVTLTASASSDSRFTGWSGDCSGTGSCVVTMSQARSVTATFVALPQLTVTRTGEGLVSSNPSGISCGDSCAYRFGSGGEVVLTASAASGYQFVGWAGPCSGTGICRIDMDSSKEVGATFAPVEPSPPVFHRLTVDTTGPGSVRSNPEGIDCGLICSFTFASTSEVVLTPAPDSGARFVGFAGACSGTDVCRVAMSRAQEVSAQFEVAEPSNSFTAYNRVDKISKSSITISNKVKLPGPGLVEETVADQPTKSRPRPPARCRVSQKFTEAGVYTLTCKMGKSSRSALKKRALKLVLTVAYTPTGGQRAVKKYSFTLAKKR